VSDSDVVVAGGGAAGLSAALFAALEDARVLVLEQLASGGQQLLVDAVANYPGAPHTPGYELSKRMEAQAVAAGATVTNGTVVSARPDGGRLIVTTRGEEIRAGALVLATGTEPRPLGVPGEKELTGRGVSTCAACDGPLFRGRRVVVVGGGDAAYDEAIFLSQVTDHVLLVDRHETPRVQASLARRARETASIEIRRETEVLEILGDGKVQEIRLRDRTLGRDYTEPADGVFVFVGSYPTVPDIPGVRTDEGGYVVTDEHMVRAGPFRQCIVAAAEGAIAGHAAALHARSHEQGKR
jgi:thioredoxin reductase (NADPH)